MQYLGISQATLRAVFEGQGRIYWCGLRGFLNKAGFWEGLRLYCGHGAVRPTWSVWE